MKNDEQGRAAGRGPRSGRETRALRDSEAKYRALIETTGTGYLILDSAGRVVDANAEYVRLSGHRELREILGRSVVEWTAAYEKERNEAAVAECVRLGFVRNLAIDYVDGAGRITPVEINATVEGQGEESRIISLCRDITGRRRAESALRDSEARNRRLVENLGAEYFFYQHDSKGVFTYLSPSVTAMLGYSLEEFLTHYTQYLTDNPVNKAVEAHTALSLEGVQQPAYEVELLDKNGSRRWLEVMEVPLRGKEGGVVGVEGLAHDITGRKQAEAALREAFEMQGVLNAMLQNSLADNSSLREKLDSQLGRLFALPWLSVQPKGAVFLMNSRGGELVMTAQKGLAPGLLKTCGTVALGYCLCGKAAQSGRVVEAACVGADHQVTYEGIIAHGHYCAPIAARGKTLGVLNLYLEEGTRLSGSQRRFLKSVTDIMAENILHAQTEEKLAQSQRMESVGRLAGGVAHDFNNILTAIKCYAEFIRKDLDPQDPKLEDVREILTASGRAVALTQQLLAFSRRQIMAPKEVDLNRCVGDVTKMLRRLIGEDIKLDTKLAPAPCLAMLDTGQIEQVLVNLVVNARDAMPEGGKIEIATELLPPSAELLRAHPDLRPGPLVCLKVSDAGCGMTAEVLSHIYEPFYTTKEQGKGTGLGLATVFGIVKQSGGDIEVESEPGRGARFRICFPYAAAGEGASPGQSGECAVVAAGSETILLVEDEESLLRLGKRVLASNGYKVLAASSGPEALKELERYGKPVDLLITDVVMPGMSGREVALEIARRHLAGRTLYMSGYTDDAIVKHGVLEPGLAFIYKPFTVDGLLAKVRTVLDAPCGQSRP